MPLKFTPHFARVIYPLQEARKRIMANEYVVESILGEKRVKQRRGRYKTMYLVKWEGFDEETWEPLSNLVNCRAKIDDFRATHSRKRSVTPDALATEEAMMDDTVADAVQEVAELSDPEVAPQDTLTETAEEVYAEVDATQDPMEETQETDGINVGEEDIDLFDYGIESNINSYEDTNTQRKKTGESKKKKSQTPKSIACLNLSESECDSSASDSDRSASECDDEVLLMDVAGEESGEEVAVEAYEEFAGPHDVLKSTELRKLAEKDGFVSTYYGEDTTKAAEDVDAYNGTSTVTTQGATAAKSMQPIDLFFFFLPKSLWRHIAKETNRYERQTRHERIRKSRIRLQKTYSRAVASQKFGEVQRKIGSFEDVRPHEILVLIGLLVARSLCPMKMGIEQHWSSSRRSAIPAGTWSQFMGRQRFRDIFRFLHFSDNKDPMAKKDRAWKIRPVVEVLQRTFMQGMTIGRWVAFDEMVIPSRSSRNTVRMYLKNKPHKYGTKLFAVCCGETNYCARIEVYCGSRQDTRVIDTLSGPEAVLRNLKAIWPPSKVDKSQKRVVVTDREYTCVSLAVRLYAMGFCSIGTVTPSRLGFPKELKYPFKSVPKRLAGQRGLCRLMRCTKFPDLYACSWIDNKPVYFLACGVSTLKTAITRKEKDGSSREVGCPEFVAAYNNYMNGVDAHDQLRLQRYSVQRALRAKKYYMTLFFGLIDMALVNAYIVHCQYCKNTGEKPLSHAKFRVLLHEQLISASESDFQHISSPGPSCASPFRARSSVTNHRLEFTEDKQPNGKMRYRVCKVCSIMSDTNKSVGKSRAFCVECSTEKCRIYLCDRIRTGDDNNQMTCFQIWHQVWKNGTDREGTKKIRMRACTTSDTPEACDTEEARSFVTFGSESLVSTHATEYSSR
jgi:hypothetical protein